MAGLQVSTGYADFCNLEQGQDGNLFGRNRAHPSVFERAHIGIQTVSQKIIGDTHRVGFRQQGRLKADARANKHTGM